MFFQSFADFLESNELKCQISWKESFLFRKIARCIIIFESRVYVSYEKNRMEKLKGTCTKIHDDDRFSYAIHIIHIGGVKVQFL
jgi:hypothetical protein